MWEGIKGRGEREILMISYFSLKMETPFKNCTLGYHRKNKNFIRKTQNVSIFFFLVEMNLIFIHKKKKISRNEYQSRNFYLVNYSILPQTVSPLFILSLTPSFQQFFFFFFFFFDEKYFS